MIALALLPLVVYCLIIAFLTSRNRPSVLSGTQDFMLLAAALFGLLTFGPGRLIIPVQLLSFWGLTIWFFWFAFYVVVFYVVAERLMRPRIVIYRCSMKQLIPALISWANSVDPQFRFEGNVLYLPGLKIQCALTGDRFGGHVQLVPTSRQNRGVWEMFRQQLATVCAPLFENSNKPAIFWSLLALCLFVLSIVCLIEEAPMLIERFADYYLD